MSANRRCASDRSGAFLKKEKKVGSEQREDLGEKWFEKLQKEVAESGTEAQEEFRRALHPDAMGPSGKEGIDE